MKKLFPTLAALLIAAAGHSQASIEFYSVNKETKTTEGDVKFTFFKNGGIISPKAAMFTVQADDSTGVWVSGGKGTTGDMTIVMKVYPAGKFLEMSYTRVKKDNSIDAVFFYRNEKPVSMAESIGNDFDKMLDAIKKEKEEKKAKKEAEKAAAEKKNE